MLSEARSFIAPLRDPQEDNIKIPPNNVPAEQALLGAIFRNNLALSRVSGFLRAEFFFNGVNGRIYAAIEKLVERGQVANPVTLKNLFDQDGALTEIGGAAYLTQLAEAAVTIINAEDYGRRVYDLYLRRQLIGIGDDIMVRAYREDLDFGGAEQMAQAEADLYELAQTDGGTTGPRSVGGFAKEALERAEAAYNGEGKVAGVPSGIADLDRKIGGYPNGFLIYIGGAPGQGKTTLCSTLLLSAARRGLRSIMFSAELSGQDMTMMLLAGLTGISSERQLRGDLTVSDWNEMSRAQAWLDACGIEIDDTPSIDIATLRQRAVQAKRRKGLHLILGDYVQLFKAGGSSVQDNMAANVRRVSNGLRELAKELDVPVVVTSQLVRDVDKREDKRPMMSDLRWAAELEQDAHIIGMLYRNEYYLSRAEPVRGPNESDLKFAERHVNWVNALDDARGRAEIIIPKNRFGKTGVARCFFDPERSLFVDDSREIDTRGDLL